MVAPGQGFTHRFLLALKFLSGYEHRSTLPQSRIRSTAPSEREPGMAVPFIVLPGDRKVAGDFHRPYGTQRWGHFTIQRGTLPLVRWGILCYSWLCIQQTDGGVYHGAWRAEDYQDCPGELPGSAGRSLSPLQGGEPERLSPPAGDIGGDSQ